MSALLTVKLCRWDLWTLWNVSSEVSIIVRTWLIRVFVTIHCMILKLPLPTFIQEEEQRKQREEQEKREHEEYLRLKESFVVEEEGEAGGEDAEEVRRSLFLNLEHNISCQRFGWTTHHTYEINTAKSNQNIEDKCLSVAITVLTSDTVSLPVHTVQRDCGLHKLYQGRYQSRFQVCRSGTGTSVVTTTFYFVLYSENESCLLGRFSS